VLIEAAKKGLRRGRTFFVALSFDLIFLNSFFNFLAKTSKKKIGRTPLFFYFFKYMEANMRINHRKGPQHLTIGSLIR
jgi:hypothetical protein